MKNFVLMILLCIYVHSTTFSQVYTPNGTQLDPNNLFYLPEASQNDLDYYTYCVQTLYPNAVILAPATTSYNCHGWAWHVSEGGSAVWINDPNDNVYWQDNSYIFSTETGNSKVSYVNGDHSAITTCTESMYISKWGAWPRVRHSANYTPYDSGQLWRFIKGCTGTPQLTPRIYSSGSNSICNTSGTFCNENLTVYLNPSCPSTNYSWTFEPSYLSSNGNINSYGASASITNWGFVRIRAEASGLNGSASVYFYFNGCGQMSYSVYPNPTDENLNISFQDEKSANALVKEISLIDKNGRLVQTFDNKSNEILETKGTSFNTRGLPKGAYFIHIKVGDEIKKEQILIE